MDLAASPREADRTQERYRWIARVLGSALIDPDGLMQPFAVEMPARAASGRGGDVLVMDGYEIIRPPAGADAGLRRGERALPFARRVDIIRGAIGFKVQTGLLDAVASWMPAVTEVRFMGDRSHSSGGPIAPCRVRGWSFRSSIRSSLKSLARTAPAWSRVRSPEALAGYKSSTEGRDTVEMVTAGGGEGDVMAEVRCSGR